MNTLDHAQKAHNDALHEYYAASARAARAGVGRFDDDDPLTAALQAAASAAYRAEHAVGIATANMLSAQLEIRLTREELSEELRRAINSKAVIESSGLTFEAAILAYLDSSQWRVDGGFAEYDLRKCQACKSHWPWGRKLSMSDGQRGRAWRIIATHCALRPTPYVTRDRTGGQIILTDKPQVHRIVPAHYAPPYQIKSEEREQGGGLRVVPA